MKLRIRGNPNLYDATLLVHDSDCEDLGWPAALRISWGDGEQVFAAPDVAIRNCKLAWATPEEWRTLAEYGFLPDNTPK